MIPAERFPPDFCLGFPQDRGKTFRKQVITYHLPFTGTKELLYYRPSMRVLWTTEVTVEADTLWFDVVNWRDDPDEVRRQANDTLARIREQAEHVANNVEAYNNQLETEALRVLQARRATLLKQSNLMAALGVPLRKAENVPATFSVPLTPKRIAVTSARPSAKPGAPISPFEPEPTLEDTSYQEILRILHDIGREMERHPSTYGGKDEETLRDLFILVLTPHFQSVTGETFNKQGKTDILVRQEGDNLFVAECKFWHGPKGYQETIDQLLSYLTWRDSKTAIMLFVRNREFQAVLDQIPVETAAHPCFVKDNGAPGDGRFLFEFRLRDDQHRRVWLTILCFHFPESS